MRKVFNGRYCPFKMRSKKNKIIRKRKVYKPVKEIILCHERTKEEAKRLLDRIRLYDIIYTPETKSVYKQMLDIIHK